MIRSRCRYPGKISPRSFGKIDKIESARNMISQALDNRLPQVKRQEFYFAECQIRVVLITL